MRKASSGLLDRRTMNEFEKMNDTLTKTMPTQMASAVNMFAHPAVRGGGKTEH